MPLAVVISIGLFWGKSSISPSFAEDLAKQKTEVEVLQKQIEVIGEQQQNFITGAVGFFGILSLYNLIREFALSHEEKKDLKEKITKELSKKIEEIAKEELIEIKRNLKWLEYQTAVLRAEQFKSKFDTNAPYEYNSLCAVALYERIRAILILGELKQIENLDRETEYRFNCIFDSLYSATQKEITSSIKSTRNPEEEARNKVMLKMLLKTAGIGEMISNIPEDKYSNKLQELLEEMGINN